MKILYSKSTVPTWAIILVFLIANLLCLIFFALNLYFAIAMVIFINWLTYKGLKNARILDKWKKNTLEKDPFFQQNNFSLGSYGGYSLLAVSDLIVRVVNFNSSIQVHRTNYDISEVYKNYPRQGIDIVLNGMNVYHFDIPIATIKSAEPILQGDAGGFGVLNSVNFGIRITTINDEIYDIDTPFSTEFSDQINSFIPKN
jgi:energy-coupling factor transporter transmembrane protein EcfT